MMTQIVQIRPRWETFDNQAGRYLQMDAVDAARMYRSAYEGKVQAIFVDLPFNAGANHLSQRVAEKGWKGDRKYQIQRVSQTIRNGAGMQGYTSYLAQVATESRALLRDDGALWIHTDWRSSPYIRLMMDTVFGRDHLVNEVIWSYQTSAAAGHYFARRHDVLLLYAKGKEIAFQESGVGEQRGRTQRGHLRRGEENGRVYFALGSGSREKRYYEDDWIHPGDVWTDIPGMRPRDEERTGFEMQRPLALYERMIKATSAPGDYVADFFVGSGTTAEAAGLSGRIPLVSDRDPMTRHLFRRRMCAAGAGYRMEPTASWMVPGLKISADVEGSRLYLNAYDIPGGEQYIAHSLLPDYCSIVDFWAVGTMEGDTFRIRRFSMRSQEHPILEQYLDGLGANLAFMVADVYGNETYWQVIRD